MTSSVLCSATLLGDPAPGQPKGCWFGPIPGGGAGTIQSTGGSNYPFYVQNNGNWDINERVLIGLYHLNPNLVQAQLQQMYQAGQRKVSLFLWYMPFVDSQTPVAGYASQYPDVWVGWLNSSGGQLSKQAQQNLAAICKLIQQIGFNEVTLRFAPVGNTASPVNWGNTWNEAAFEQDEAFIFNTRQVMENALAGTAVQRTYDLGAELGGIPHFPSGDGVTYTDGQTPQWTARLWSDYVSRYGKKDTYGFSMAYSPGTLTKSLLSYDQAGVRPDSYAVDLNAATDLWSYYQELEGAGETAKPLVIQEVDYNDPTMQQGILSELQHVPLTIAYLDQYPAATANSTTNDVTPPTNYGAYGGSNATTGTLVVNPCTLASGAATCTTEVSWATSNANDVVLYINGVPAQNASNIATTLTGTTTISLGLQATTLSLVSSQGVLANAVSSSGPMVLQSTTITAIDPTAPAITLAGLGGTNLQAIWAIGNNISSGCAVQLYDGNHPGSSALATITTAACAGNSLSFVMPTGIAQAYPNLQLTVTNPGSGPSSPVAVGTQPMPTLGLSGLGGISNQSLWATGTNISAGCSVKLYDPNNSGAPLATLTDVSCAPTCISAVVPSFLRGSFGQVNVTVVNADGQESQPAPLNLHSF